jgi:hypothetical protein
MNILKSRGACGGVQYEAIGAPITSAVCYCARCQHAGRARRRRPSATVPCIPGSKWLCA